MSHSVQKRTEKISSGLGSLDAQRSTKRLEDGGAHVRKWGEICECSVISLCL